MAQTYTAFGDEDRRRVNEAIQKAEATTSAEILPVVARSSGRYDRAEDIVGLWLAAVAMVVTWLVFPAPGVEEGSWGGPSPYWQLVALLAAMLVGFVAGAFLGSKIFWLRRLFSPAVQMNEEVLARARQIFFDKRVHHTGSSAGVLLYVSLYEHIAAVIADQTVLEKLGQEAIDEICHEFTKRLHDSSAVDAVCETADDLGQRLQPLLPRAEDDANELPDALIVID